MSDLDDFSTTCKGKPTPYTDASKWRQCPAVSTSLIIVTRILYARRSTVLYVGGINQTIPYHTALARVTNRLSLYKYHLGTQKTRPAMSTLPATISLRFRRSAFVDLKNMEIKSRSTHTQLLPLWVSLFDKRVS